MARTTSITDVFSSIDKAFSELKYVNRYIDNIESDDIDCSDIKSSVDDVKSALEEIKSELENFNSDLESKLGNIRRFFEEVLD